jgi:hypothetical protein
MRVLKHQQQSSQTTVGCRTRFQKSLQMILVHRGAAVVDWVPASCTGVSPAGSQYRSARASRRSESRSCFLTDTEPLGVAVVGCGCDPVAATPFASRLLGERRSDDRRELYCCEGCIEVDVAADPRMEFFDPRDVGVWSALFCLCRSLPSYLSRATLGCQCLYVTTWKNKIAFFIYVVLVPFVLQTVGIPSNP